MDDFKATLKRMHKLASTWVVFIASALAAFWLQMSPDDQAVLLDVFPALKLIAPGIGFAAFVVARGWPQSPKE